MDAEFLMLDFEDEDGSGEGGYAKVMSEEFIKAEMALFAEQAEGRRHHHHHGADSRQAGAETDYRRHGRSMKDGSVVVDLAAEQGGNCELTEPDEVVVKRQRRHHHRLHRPAEPPGRAVEPALRHQPAPPADDMTPEKDGEAIVVDMEDEVIRGATVIKDGEITWPPPAAEAVGRGAAGKAPEPRLRRPAPSSSPRRPSLIGHDHRHGHRRSGAVRPRRGTRRRRSWRTSRCSCWPASSATW